MSDITVPLLDLKPQYAALRDEIRTVIDEVVESQYFILGPTVARFEEEIAAYCDCKYAVGCASGSDAILLALMAAGIGPGDEVICPSYTFFATAGYITNTGATPVFAEMDPVSYNLDVDSVREVAKQCKSLKAIMPVHLYGQAVDMDAFLALGKELGVPIIEDAAQAIGAIDSAGAKAGSRGKAGCFSFFPTKNLGGFGDGGMVTTNDEAMAEQMRILRMHGSKPKYYHQVVGVNSRLDALQAAVLSVKLKHLDAWHEQRLVNATHYDKAFAAGGALTSASPISSGGFPLRTPQPAVAPARHIYNQYIIRVPAEIRDSLREHLTEQKIGTEIYYPVPLHMQECFADLGYKEGDMVESELAAAQTIALPIYADLSTEQLDHVASTILEYISVHATQPAG